MNVKVSICIPAYNEPQLLHRSLRSICDQTYRSFEVVISDDSPDSTVETVVKQYNHALAIRYYRNLVRKGTPENWNEAIRHAEGEYIKILHHDDWFSQPNSLRKYVELLDVNP